MDAGSAAPADQRPIRAAVAVSVLLVPLQLGWVPALRRWWGFDLWQYLPAPGWALLAAALLVVCVPLSRRALLGAVQFAHARILARWRPGLGVGLLALLPFVFWTFRERQFFGDSNLLLLTAFSGWQFAVPDIGSTWLLRQCVVVADALGLDPWGVMQALVCICGALAVGLFAAASRHLADSPGRRAFLVALALGGGTLRVFFGHVEVYAFVLACAGAYLWSALAFLNGRVGWAVPGLVLGVGVWMHLSLGFALPTLLLLFALAKGARPRSALFRRGVAGLALAGVPILAFLLLMWVGGHHEDLARGADKTVRILGFGPDPHVEGGSFVQPWGAVSSAGTDYVIFSRPHLKYLVNDFFVLAPAAVPVLLGFALFARRRFACTPEAKFLSGLCACLAVYSAIVRPVWGPHDWDIFALTAVCLATLAGLLLVQRYDDHSLAPLAAVLIGATLAFVTIPLLAIGVAPAHEAGPFAHGAIPLQEGDTAWQTFLSQIEPWL